MLGLHNVRNQHSFLICYVGLYYQDPSEFKQDLLAIITRILFESRRRISKEMNLTKPVRLNYNWQELFAKLTLVPEANKFNHQLVIPVVQEAESNPQAAAHNIQVMLNRLKQNDPEKFNGLSTSVHAVDKAKVFIKLLSEHYGYVASINTTCVVTLNNLPFFANDALVMCHELLHPIIKYNGDKPYTIEILKDITHEQAPAFTSTNHFVNANLAAPMPTIPVPANTAVLNNTQLPVLTSGPQDTFRVTIHFYSDSDWKGNIIIPMAVNINQPILTKLIDAWDWLFALPAFEEIIPIIDNQQIILSGINSSHIVDLWLKLLRHLPAYQGTNTTLELFDLALSPNDANYATKINVTLLQDKLKIMMMGAQYNYTSEHDITQEIFPQILAGFRATEQRMQATLTQFGQNRLEFYASLPLALRTGLFGGATALDATTAPPVEADTYYIPPN